MSKKPANTKGKGKASNKALMLLLYLPILAFFPYPTIVGSIGLIPSFVALIADRSREKYPAICVSALNFVGVLPFIKQILRNGNNLNAAGDVLGNPFSLLVMFGAAGLGIIFIKGIPHMACYVKSIQKAQEREKLIKRQQELIEEWGRNLNQLDKNIDAYDD